MAIAHHANQKSKQTTHWREPAVRHCAERPRASLPSQTERYRWIHTGFPAATPTLYPRLAVSTDNGQNDHYEIYLDYPMFTTHSISLPGFMYAHATYTTVSSPLPHCLRLYHQHIFCYRYGGFGSWCIGCQGGYQCCIVFRRESYPVHQSLRRHYRHLCNGSEYRGPICLAHREQAAISIRQYKSHVCFAGYGR